MRVQFSAPVGARFNVSRQAAAGEVRCAAAHGEDVSACVGSTNVVIIVDEVDVSAMACRWHGAVLLASLAGGRVYPGPGGRDRDAIVVWQDAQSLPPFAFWAKGNTKPFAPRGRWTR